MSVLFGALNEIIDIKALWTVPGILSTVISN